MVFASRRTVKLVQQSVNVAYFFKVVPFRWAKSLNGRGFVLEFPVESEGKLCAWDLVKYLFLVHQVFLTIRLLQSIFAKDVPLTSFVIQSVYYVQFLIASIYQASLIRNGQDWSIFVNQYLQFFDSLKGNLYKS
jgi:hypothetical protein